MTDPSRPFAVVGLLLVLIAVACTSSDAGRAQPTAAATPAPTPRGWMLSSGHVFGQGLTATRLPDGDPQRMGLANDMVVVDAAWSEPGNTAFAFVQSGDQNALQLERVGMSGTATPIGDPIRDFSAIAAAGSVLLVSSCADGNGDTRVILAGGNSWMHVADACAATLSPDGRSLSFSTDGHTIQSMPVAGGSPTTVMDLDEVAGRLRGGHIDEMSWGRAGLGIVLHRGPRYGVVVHADSGDHVAEITGNPAFVGRLRWQPSGTLLAFVTFFQGQGSVMRVVDADSGEVRVLATDSRGLAGTVWAPDGSLLASLDSRGAWLFLEPDGRRATSVQVDNQLPFDWGE